MAEEAEAEAATAASTAAAFPPGSMGAAWAATFGGEGAGPPESEAALPLGTARDFVAALQRYAPEWAQLFQRIPPDGKSRKDALAAALGLRTAGKRLEALFKELSGPPAADAGDEAEGAAGEAAASAAAGRPSNEVLADCQAVFREISLAFLQVSAAVDELLPKEKFCDVDQVYEARDRLRTASGLTRALAGLFAKEGVDPKSTAKKAEESDENMDPEMKKMVEKLMAENKGSTAAPSEELKAARAAWERSAEGLCSVVLGDEVWEALNWRRAIFLFSFITERLNAQAKGADEGDAPPLDLFDEALRCFDLMLHGQGPIPSDRDDPASWQANYDGPHVEETARMFHHGVYSSSHLRGLKFFSELCYLKWKHTGKKDRALAELTAVSNRKFTHVVRHIIPGAGWTADVEYDRVVEVEKDALESTTIYSHGLNDKPTAALAGGKPARGSGPGKSGGAIADGDAAAVSGRKSKKGSKKK